MTTYLIFLLCVVVFFYFHIKRQEKQLWIAQVINRKMNEERDAVLSFLDKIGSSLTSMTDPSATLDIILSFIMDGTTARAGAIFLMDTEQQLLWCRSVNGPFPPTFDISSYVITKEKYLHEAIKRTPIRVGQGILGKVAQTGRPFVKTGKNNEPCPEGFCQDVESLIIDPLKTGSKILGVLAVADKEIGTFDADDERFVRSLSGQASLMIEMAMMYHARAETERIERELAIAREIQKLLIPEEILPVSNFEIAFKSIPAKEVGGDYYDVFDLENDKVGIVIADVCGKGVPGALVMTMLRSVLRTQALSSVSPGEVLSEVNSIIYDDIKRDMFITVLYAVLDVKNRELTFARAGHNPLLIYRSELQEYDTHTPEGIALGIVKGSAVNDLFPEETVAINHGDIILFTTDGG